MAKEKFLTYKGKPLVRCGNQIYYGNMTDKYVVLFTILSTEKLDDLDLSGKVSIQVLATDPDILNPKEKIVRKSEKQGLFNALDIGAIWLERALKNN